METMRTTTGRIQSALGDSRHEADAFTYWEAIQGVLMLLAAAADATASKRTEPRLRRLAAMLHAVTERTRVPLGKSEEARLIQSFPPGLIGRAAAFFDCPEWIAFRDECALRDEDREGEPQEAEEEFRELLGRSGDRAVAAKTASLPDGPLDLTLPTPDEVVRIAVPVELPTTGPDGRREATLIPMRLLWSADETADETADGTAADEAGGKPSEPNRRGIRAAHAVVSPQCDTINETLARSGYETDDSARTGLVAADDFDQGVRQGLQAGLRLLESWGVDADRIDRCRRLEVQVRSFLPDYAEYGGESVRGRSVALAVAVATVARGFGNLPLDPRTVITGVLARTPNTAGVVASRIDRQDFPDGPATGGIAGKFAAAARLGAAQFLAPAGAEVDTSETATKLVTAESVDQAMRVLFGGRYVLLGQQVARTAFPGVGYEIGWQLGAFDLEDAKAKTPPAPHSELGPFPAVGGQPLAFRSPQVDAAVESLARQPRTGCRLLGRPGTGRSTMARQVATELEKRGWRVLPLRNTERVQHDDDMLRKTMELARLWFGPSPSDGGGSVGDGGEPSPSRCLVVLDCEDPIFAAGLGEAADDADEITERSFVDRAERAANAQGLSVLAVVDYRDGSGLVSNEEILSVNTADMLVPLLVAAVERCGEALGRPVFDLDADELRRLCEAVSQGSRSDLFGSLRMIEHFAREEAQQRHVAVGPAGRSRQGRRLAVPKPELRDMLRVQTHDAIVTAEQVASLDLLTELAAWSWIGVPFPDERIPAGLRPHLLPLSARRVAGGWLVDHYHTRRSMIQRGLNLKDLRTEEITFDAVRFLAARLLAADQKQPKPSLADLLGATVRSGDDTIRDIIGKLHSLLNDRERGPDSVAAAQRLAAQFADHERLTALRALAEPVSDIARRGTRLRVVLAVAILCVDAIESLADRLRKAPGYTDSLGYPWRLLTNRLAAEIGEVIEFESLYATYLKGIVGNERNGLTHLNERYAEQRDRLAAELRPLFGNEGTLARWDFSELSVHRMRRLIRQMHLSDLIELPEEDRCFDARRIVAERFSQEAEGARDYYGGVRLLETLRRLFDDGVCDPRFRTVAAAIREWGDQPPRGGDVEPLLAHYALRQWFRRFGPALAGEQTDAAADEASEMGAVEWERPSGELQAAVLGADARQMIRGFSYVRAVSRDAARRLIGGYGGLDLVETIRPRWAAMSYPTAADLLDTIRAIDPGAAVRLVYTGPEVTPPFHDEVHAHLLSRSWTGPGTGAKGVSKIIKAAVRLDRYARHGGPLLSEQFADRVGVNYWKAHDLFETRSKVLMHLLEALTSVGCPIDSGFVADAVTQVAQFEETRPHPIALRIVRHLLGHTEVSGQVEEGLRDRVKAEHFAAWRRSLRRKAVDAVECIADLATVSPPAVADWGAEVSDSLKASDASGGGDDRTRDRSVFTPQAILREATKTWRDAVRLARADNETLRRSHGPAAAEAHRRAFRERWTFDRWCFRIQDDAGQYLSVLAKFDPVAAASVVEEVILDDSDAPLPIPPRVLQKPTEFETLLAAIRACSPAAAETLLARLPEDETYAAGWRWFLKELRYQSDPRTAADLHLSLSRSGFVVDPDRRAEFARARFDEATAITSPGTAARLLRLAALWDAAPGSERLSLLQRFLDGLAEVRGGKSTLDRTVQRLERASAPDREGAAALVRTHLAVGDRPTALRLLHALPEPSEILHSHADEALANLRLANEYVLVRLLADEPMTTPSAQAYVQRVAELVDARHVCDDAAWWRAIGDAGLLAFLHGEELTLRSERPPRSWSYRRAAADAVWALAFCTGPWCDAAWDEVVAALGDEVRPDRPPRTRARWRLWVATAGLRGFASPAPLTLADLSSLPPRDLFLMQWLLRCGTPAAADGIDAAAIGARLRRSGDRLTDVFDAYRHA